MSCIACGPPNVAGETYCGQCGPSLGPASVQAPGEEQVVVLAHPTPAPRTGSDDVPSTTLRAAAAGAALIGVVCLIVSLYQPYSYTGPAAVPRQLGDAPGPVAYITFQAAGAAAGALLLLFRRTTRLGAGMLTGAALVFAAQLISTTGDFLRSTASGTDLFLGPGTGYWLNLATGAALVLAAALAFTGLARTGALRLRPSRLGIPWTLTGLALTALYFTGSWMPWVRYTVTQETDGRVTTRTLSECCTLSTGQALAQEIAIATVMVLLVHLAGRLLSVSAASGLVLGSAAGVAATVVATFLTSPWTLDDLALTWDVPVADLVRDKTVLGTELLTGTWLATAAVLGLAILAGARVLPAARRP